MPVGAARQAELAGSQVPWRFFVTKVIDADDYGPHGRGPRSAVGATLGESDTAAGSSSSSQGPDLCSPLRDECKQEGHLVQNSVIIIKPASFANEFVSGMRLSLILRLVLLKLHP